MALPKWPNYSASTDKGLLQLEVIHRYLSEESHWAKGVSMDAVRRRTDGSFCIGLYEKKLDGMWYPHVGLSCGGWVSSYSSGSLLQIANGCWVTNMTTFAYLADVFVLLSYQGTGLGE
jgi:hypothetical protein